MKFLLLLVPFLLYAETIYKSSDTKKKVDCKIVCDKREYKEKQISKAIEFYKNSKEYDLKKISTR